MPQPTTPNVESDRYHHGDLPATLLAATADAVAEHGVDGISLRDIARRSGVSHAAPAHHFGSRTGLLTAFAAQGFEAFAAALAAAPGETPAERLRSQAHSYITFAIDHRPHFEVMWRPDLCNTGNDVLDSSRLAAYLTLWDAVAATTGETDHDAIAAKVLTAWALVHGLSWLILQEALPPGLDNKSPAELNDLVGDVFLAGLFGDGPT